MSSLSENMQYEKAFRHLEEQMPPRFPPGSESKSQIKS